MEYFPLGNISSNLWEFGSFRSEFKKLKAEMDMQRTKEEFGDYMVRWQKARTNKKKIKECNERLMLGVYGSLNQFHNVHKLVHLDVKGIHYKCSMHRS